jgi:O-methyltransferase
MRKAFTALSFNGISGDYLEFGSWSGNTFTLAYQQSRRVGHQCMLWSFDSFQGLPDQAGAEDEHPHWQKAAMSMSLQQFNDICRQHNIPVSDYQVVPGYYTDTIGNESNLGVFPRDVALAYIDCDMYSSTKVVLSFLASRLKHGMIIAFDDYYCFSKSTLAGERKAFLEFTASNCRFNFAAYVQFGWHGMSFIVEDRSLLPEDDNAGRSGIGALQSMGDDAAYGWMPHTGPWLEFELRSARGGQRPFASTYRGGGVASIPFVRITADSRVCAICVGRFPFHLPLRLQLTFELV